MPARTKPGALPAYLRIAEHLTIEIASGRLVPGQRLPPERQMAARYGVSPMTLRKALAIVTERGLIARRQGSGNYVARGAHRRDLGTYALFRLEAVPEGGGLPTAEVLSFEPEAGPGPDALGPSRRIRRLRRLDGIPAALEEIWLPLRHGDLTEAALSESLYRTYAQVLGLVIAHAEDRVGVGTCPDWAPASLGTAPGATMGLVERRGFDQDASLAEVSRTWFDPARARYFATVP
jgi:GntR family transcriptional regulator